MRDTGKHLIVEASVTREKCENRVIGKNMGTDNAGYKGNRGNKKFK